MIVRSPTTTQAPKVRGCAAAAEKRNLLSRRAGVTKSGGGGGGGGQRRAAHGSGSISTKPGCRAVIDSYLPLLDDCATQRSVAPALRSKDDVHGKGSGSGDGSSGNGDSDEGDEDDNDNDDGDSVCSDKFSRSSCSGCCDDDQCSEECADSCFGFIDCDDAEACTSRDCAESECRETAPPCFDVNCLQSPAAGDAAAAAAATAACMFQPHLVAPIAQHGHGDLSGFAYHDDAFQAHSQSDLQFNNMLYPPFNTTAIATNYIPDNNLMMPSEAAAFTSCADADGSLMHHGHHQHPPPPAAVGPGAYVSAALNAPPLSAATESSHLASGYGTTQPFYCQWGGNCDGQFFDWTALDEHVIQDHIKPLSEVQCRWNECQQAVNPADMVAHVLNSHPLDGVQPTCRWTECSLTLPGPEGLESHVRSTHVPAYPLHCQWDSCGALALDAVDLSQHLHVDHSLAAPLLPAARSVAEEAMATATASTTAAVAGTVSTTTRSPSLSAGAQLRCRWLVASAGASGGSNGEGRECGVVCHDAAGLQQHIKEAHISSLTKKTGFLCRWADCARKDSHPFGQKGKLERHIQVHTGFKSCRCNICGQDFSGPLALQQHERRHTGEKPYRCDRCGKQFAQGTALTMHIRTHTKEKPLKCDFPGCNKTFSESSTLSKHKKTHSATGQYACEYPECNSSFHRLDQRKRHYNLVHGGLPTASMRT